MSEEAHDEMERVEKEEARVQKIKLLNSELRSEKEGLIVMITVLSQTFYEQPLERIEMKRKEMMKSLDSLKEELTELKNKQNSIDLKGQEIQKELIATRQRKNERFRNDNLYSTVP